MTSKVQQLLALIEHYRFTRTYPELVHVVMDAMEGRLADAEADRYLQFLQEQAAALDRRPTHLLEVPEDEELNADGPPDVVLGALRDDPEVPFGLRIADRPRSVILAGDVGAGKSTAIRRVIRGVDAFARARGKPVSVLVFDRKASEYSDLPGQLGPHWRHYSVHEGAWLGLNGPHAMPTHVWTNILCTIFAAAAGLVAGAAVLAHAIGWLLSRLNPVPTASPRWPDFVLLREVLSRAPQQFARKLEYAQSLGQQLDAIIDASGELFWTARGLDVEQDIIRPGHSAVFDIGNLPPPFLRMFVVWLLLAQVLFARLQRRHRVDTTEVIAVIDEADQDVSRDMEARFPDGLSPIGMLLQHGREAGVGALIGLHALADTSRTVLANAPYHVMMNLSDEHSVVEASRTLLLPRGAERIFPALRPGECIFRAAQSAWPHPLLGVIDAVQPNRDATPPQYDRPQVVPAVRLADRPELQAALAEAAKRQRVARLRAARTDKRAVSRQARSLLDAWALHPFMPLARLWQLLEVKSYATQTAAREELTELRLADFADWRIGKTLVGLMEITTAGWECLNKETPHLRGRGKIAHRHTAHWIHRVHRQRGLESHIEWPVPGADHPADVASRLGERWEVYEVVVSSADNNVSHLQACLLMAGVVETVTIVAATKGKLAGLRQTIEAEPSLHTVLERVRYEPVETFLRAAWPAGH